MPKANSRITIAAAIPIASLLSVLVSDSASPRYPPAATSSPASLAGDVASKTFCAAENVEIFEIFFEFVRILSRINR